jgi:lipopolysaccharide transport system permease protein
MTEEKNITVIAPAKGWSFFDFKEFIQYKDLLFFLSIRTFKTKYAQSVLGVSWAVIQPLFTTLVFTIVFGGLAKVEAPNGIPYQVFSFVAMLPWNFFANMLTDASNSLIQNTGMLSKVYFPRLILPLSVVFSKFIDFLIGSAVLVCFLAYYHLVPSTDIIFLPILLLSLLMSSLGVGMILAAMSVQYRDIKHALTFIIQLLMYASPVVYSASKVSEKYANIYALNPNVGIIEGFRSIFLYPGTFNWTWVIESLVVSSLLFIAGVFYFRKMERVFSDVA